MFFPTNTHWTMHKHRKGKHLPQPEGLLQQNIKQLLQSWALYNQVFQEFQTESKKDNSLIDEDIQSSSGGQLPASQQAVCTRTTPSERTLSQKPASTSMPSSPWGHEASSASHRWGRLLTFLRPQTSPTPGLQEKESKLYSCSSQPSILGAAYSDEKLYSTSSSQHIEPFSRALQDARTDPKISLTTLGFRPILWLRTSIDEVKCLSVTWPACLKADLIVTDRKVPALIMSLKRQGSMSTHAP